MKYILAITIILCSWYTAYTFGFNAHKEPVVDFIEISDPSDSYRFLSNSEYHISERNGVYIINVYSLYRDTEIIYRDIVIEGQEIKASDLAESFKRSWK